MATKQEDDASMTEEARTLLKVAEILDSLPSDEMRAKVMAMASASLGRYDYARAFVDAAERFQRENASADSEEVTS